VGTHSRKFKQTDRRKRRDPLHAWTMWFPLVRLSHADRHPLIGKVADLATIDCQRSSAGRPANAKIAPMGMIFVPVRRNKPFTKEFTSCKT